MDINNMTNGDLLDILANIEKLTALKPVVVRAWKKHDSYQVTMMAELSDGTEVELFSYYPDEISFSEREVVGMTVRDAGQLFVKKDTIYLRS